MTFLKTGPSTLTGITQMFDADIFILYIKM